MWWSDQPGKPTPRWSTPSTASRPWWSTPRTGQCARLTPRALAVLHADTGARVLLHAERVQLPSTVDVEPDEPGPVGGAVGDDPLATPERRTGARDTIGLRRSNNEQYHREGDAARHERKTVAASKRRGGAHRLVFRRSAAVRHPADTARWCWFGLRWWRYGTKTYPARGARAVDPGVEAGPVVEQPSRPSSPESPNSTYVGDPTIASFRSGCDLPLATTPQR